jgi:hypothetical protein
MATLTYTDITFGFPPTEPHVFSPYAKYYNLQLDTAKPWVRAEIRVNDIKRHTLAHTHMTDGVLPIQVKPVNPYPAFGIVVDGGNQPVYAQMYVYEATLRIYHESAYSTTEVETWCPRTEMTYRD